jgi:hypothetical protein
MTFDIHQLDKIDPASSKAEKALEKYQDALLELFATSFEGEALRQTYPEMGFWAAQLMYYGYGYIGVTLPQITVTNVKEIVTELFPRKISLMSPDETDEAIPELIAFWEYLKREYKLPQANSILKYLHKIKTDDFKAMMFDPSKAGMAKSFFMMGQSAGYDMTDEKDINTFMHAYNTNLLTQNQGPSEFYPSLTDPSPRTRKVAAQKKKRRRKVAQASRKRQRRKRKK